jgi:hypothetical protein
VSEVEPVAQGSPEAPDYKEVRLFLTLAFEVDQRVQIVGLPGGRCVTCQAGNREEVIQAVEHCSGCPTIACTLNPVLPTFDANQPAKASDILCRRWLMIDADTVRPDHNLSATDAEKEQAALVGSRIAAWLKDQGWPEPLTIDSGNGVHLRYRIDLPNDDEADRLLKAVLKSLAARFNTEAVEVDTTVANANRLARLPGTFAMKGLNTAKRPHRMARLVSVPVRLDVVSRELLIQIREPAPGAADGGQQTAPTATTKSVDDFLLVVEPDRRVERYIENVQNGELTRLALAEPGNRNNELNRAAFRLGQFIPDGYLDRDTIEEKLLLLAERIGLKQEESRRTIRSGLEAGMREPAQVPEPSSADFAVIADSSQESWDEPFLDSRPDAPLFPLSVLPSALSDLCKACTESIDAPEDFFAAAALALTGGVIGMSVNLRMSNTWLVQPHLYVVPIGPPGSRKSPALLLLRQPLAEIDEELHEEFRAALAAWHPEDGPRPIHRHLLIDDATREAVAMVHSENPRGLVEVKDEAVVKVTSLDAYRPRGRGSDKEFWLSVNTGAPIKVNRKGNQGETHVIPRPCITFLGGLTPANMDVMRPTDRDDGWLDRFLFTYPDLPSGARVWKKRDVPDHLLAAWREAIRYLWNRQPLAVVGSHVEPRVIRLDPEAEEVWSKWFTRQSGETRDPAFPPELLGPWSKLELYTVRIALILSQLHQAYTGRPGDPRNVDALTMHHAIQVSDYFKVHYRRAIYGLGRRPTPKAVRVIISRLLHDGIKEFPQSWLSKNYSRYFEDKDELQATLGWLVRHSIIRPKASSPSVPNRRGRPASPEYEVNPLIFTRFSEDLSPRCV